MKLTIFGATGGTGQHLVRQALDRGHQVVAFARSPEKLAADGENLTIVQGDSTNKEKVSQAISQAEAVVSVLGPTENKPSFTVSESTEYILSAMKDHGVDRLVVSAGAGVGDPKDEPKLINRLINFLLKSFSRWVYEDMRRTVQTVRQSELDWTIVRVPRLTDEEPTGEVKFNYVGKGMGFQITRADMARTMLDLAESDRFLHEAPAISN